MLINERAGFSIKQALNISSFVIFIAKNIKEYLSMLPQLNFFCGNAEIIKFPPWDVELYGSTSTSLTVTGRRISALLALSNESKEK